VNSYNNPYETYRAGVLSREIHTEPAVAPLG
jgi:hypothetical protein